MGLAGSVSVVVRVVVLLQPGDESVRQPKTEASVKRVERLFREKAQEKYAFCSDDDIEIDDDAKVSIADESEIEITGAFVQAWVWVDVEDLQTRVRRF